MGLDLLAAIVLPELAGVDDHVLRKGGRLGECEKPEGGEARPGAAHAGGGEDCHRMKVRLPRGSKAEGLIADVDAGNP